MRKIRLSDAQLGALEDLVYWTSLTGKQDELNGLAGYYTYLKAIKPAPICSVRISKPMISRLNEELPWVFDNMAKTEYWQNSSRKALQDISFIFNCILENRHWHMHMEHLDTEGIKLGQRIRIGWMVGKVVFKTSSVVVIIGRWSNPL